MKILRAFFFVFVLLLLALGFFHERILGMIVEPVMESALQDAFDMPFDVQGLRINALFGIVSVHKVICFNPPDFKRKEHYIAEDVSLRIRLFDLKKKCVHITRAHFKKAFFAIESYMTPQGSRTNVWHWYHHMGLDEDDPPSMLFPKLDTLSPDKAAEEMAAKGKWRVKIDHLTLDDGTFLFDDRREADEHHWIFRKLKGYWKGFDFISEYTSSRFTEYIKLEGTFGNNPEARFEGEGQCQFADGDNFDIQTQISEGSVAEYDFLLSGLPGEVKGGTFDLVSHARCLESNLKSEHVLTLYSLQLSSPTTVQKLLKYPFKGVQLLLETQKSIQLEVKVNGYIGDPKFHFFRAFTKAFQKSLITKAKTAFTGFTNGTAKLASAATPAPLKSGLGTLGDILTSPFSRGTNQEVTDEKT